jgi:hypothetical protein
MKTVIAGLALVVSAFLAQPAAAQDKQAERSPDVPKDQRPPPGMCRIWIDGVPPNKQPASTDCPTAVKNRPRNGRVIFGDDYVKSDKRKPSSLIKNFTDDGKNPLEKVTTPEPPKPKKPRG